MMKRPQPHSELASDRVFLYSPQDNDGRDTVAIGLIDVLARRGRHLDVFQPLAPASSDGCSSLDLLLRACADISNTASKGSVFDRKSHRAIDPNRFYLDTSFSRREIVSDFYESTTLKNVDYAVILGTDQSAVVHPNALCVDALLTADLQSPVLLVIDGRNRNAHDIAETIKACERAVSKAGSTVLGAFVSPCVSNVQEETRIELIDFALPVWFVPPANFDGSPKQAIESSVEAFRQSVDERQLLAALARPVDTPVTPPSFQYSLMESARRQKKTIVLPEGNAERVLAAANYVLDHGAADIILLGNEARIRRHAQDLNLSSLSQARVLPPDDPVMLKRMVPELVSLRASKGLDEAGARKLLEDSLYYGTMLVYLGVADGMVSGAVHSTADTVRPALQIIRTRSGEGIVSGAMFMCMECHVDVYADVALVPDPTAKQLALIAAQTARTASALGINPIIGFLSYSTLDSGTGPDVDLVREAVAIAHREYPELKIVGPIQFDAAWSPIVGKLKAPGNPYAGHVNVFIAPDLDAGNILYKSVERTSGATAVGPVLQGLRQPVNDLSRGSTVRDIVNTIALTAIGAQGAL
ncbi:MAG: phosphate acetyltransferase [Aeriscardovia sp.]|nr:phosphate acetyltransferase [Aeriscardovia sp.]